MGYIFISYEGGLSLKVGFLQTSPKFGEVAGNINAALKGVERLAKKGAKLVVLPELFNTGYQFKDKREARSLAEDTLKGYTVARLMEMATSLNIHIVAGLPELSRGKLYNSSVLVGPKGVKGTYRKLHLFSNEKNIFSPGTKAPEVYRVGLARVGMMICFDWLFPEVASSLAVGGADIICHPSNLVLPHCPAAMPTRAIENRVFAITANRVGVEERRKNEKLTFIGKSQVVAPSGEVLVRAPSARAAFGLVDIDFKKARDKRITPYNDIFKDNFFK